MKILYLVHNAGDPAVIRRVQTFLSGGADLTVVGFQRSNAAVSFGAAKFISLGLCFDGRLVHRLGVIMRALVFSYRFRSELAAADMVVARNLDMLLIGSTAKSQFRARASLVYECLDVHRMMLADSVAGRALRAIERKLLQASDLLLVSSPAFVENYFEPVQGSSTPYLLVENKVMRLDESAAVTVAPSGRPPGPPWRIGWFGVIRCAKSLDFLIGLAARYPGLVEVVIRGRPFLPLFDDFHGAIAKQPGVEFLGPYTADDLSDMYTDVHFTWAIDFFEEGQNSTWLLPNRLYEGPLFGAVPIAFSNVETGKWLARHRAGLLIDDLEDAASALPALSAHEFDAMVEQVANMPRSDLVLDKSECVKIVESLRLAASATNKRLARKAAEPEANAP